MKGFFEEYWPILLIPVFVVLVVFVFVFDKPESKFTYRACSTGLAPKCFEGDKIEKQDSCVVVEGKGAVCGNYTVTKQK